MNAKARAAMERFVQVAYNEGKPEQVRDLIAPDMVDHDPTPGQAPGVEGTLQKPLMFRAAFPDMRTWNEDVVADGDRVVHRWVAKGTFSGQFMGMPGDGRKYQFTGIDILRFTDGQFHE